MAEIENIVVGPEGELATRDELDELMRWAKQEGFQRERSYSHESKRRAWNIRKGELHIKVVNRAHPSDPKGKKILQECHASVFVYGTNMAQFGVYWRDVRKGDHWVVKVIRLLQTPSRSWSLTCGKSFLIQILEKMIPNTFISPKVKEIVLEYIDQSVMLNDGLYIRWKALKQIIWESVKVQIQNMFPKDEMAVLKKYKLTQPANFMYIVVRDLTNSKKPDVVYPFHALPFNNEEGEVEIPQTPAGSEGHLYVVIYQDPQDALQELFGKQPGKYINADEPLPDDVGVQRKLNAVRTLEVARMCRAIKNVTFVEELEAEWPGVVAYVKEHLKNTSEN